MSIAFVSDDPVKAETAPVPGVLTFPSGTNVRTSSKQEDLAETVLGFIGVIPEGRQVNTEDPFRVLTFTESGEAGDGSARLHVALVDTVEEETVDTADLSATEAQAVVVSILGDNEEAFGALVSSVASFLILSGQVSPEALGL